MQSSELNTKVEDQAKAIMVIANKVNDRLVKLEALVAQLMASGAGNASSSNNKNEAKSGARDALLARSEIKSLRTGLEDTVTVLEMKINNLYFEMEKKPPPSAPRAWVPKDSKDTTAASAGAREAKEAREKEREEEEEDKANKRASEVTPMSASPQSFSTKIRFKSQDDVQEYGGSASGRGGGGGNVWSARGKSAGAAGQASRDYDSRDDSGPQRSALSTRSDYEPQRSNVSARSEGGPSANKFLSALGGGGGEGLGEITNNAGLSPDLSFRRIGDASVPQAASFKGWPDGTPSGSASSQPLPAASSPSQTNRNHRSPLHQLAMQNQMQQQQSPTPSRLLQDPIDDDDDDDWLGGGLSNSSNNEDPPGPTPGFIRKKSGDGGEVRLPVLAVARSDSSRPGGHSLPSMGSGRFTMQQLGGGDVASAPSFGDKAVLDHRPLVPARSDHSLRRGTSFAGQAEQRGGGGAVLDVAARKESMEVLPRRPSARRHAAAAAAVARGSLPDELASEAKGLKLREQEYIKRHRLSEGVDLSTQQLQQPAVTTKEGGGASSSSTNMSRFGTLTRGGSVTQLSEGLTDLNRLPSGAEIVEFAEESY